MRTVFKTIWHNEHACDTLGTFDTEQEAEDAGNDWLFNMSAVDPECEEYCYEVIESEEYDDDEKLEAEYAEEASYEHFNRHVAGDR